MLAVVLGLLVSIGGQAAAQDSGGDRGQLGQVTAPDRNMAARLATEYDVGHATGDLTATVSATDEDLARLRAQGYEIGETIADESTIALRQAEREAAIRAERRSGELAEKAPRSGAPGASAPRT